MELYSKEDILSAIECCNIHKVKNIPSPTIDGMFDEFFETIEPRKFLQLLDRFNIISKKRKASNDFLTESNCDLFITDRYKLIDASEEYANSLDVNIYSKLENMKAFVAGATSKYVEKETLKEKISFCKDILILCNLNSEDENMIKESMLKFEDKLSKL